MILTKKQVKILNVFKKNLTEKLTLSQITGSLGKTSRAWSYRFIEKLSKDKILLSEMVSNTKTYMLNLENTDTLNYLSYCDIVKYKESKVNKKIINSILRNTSGEYCLVIFGSYAKNKPKKDSDLDICFLSSDDKKKRIKPIIENIKLRSLLKIDDHYLTVNDFQKMLKWEKENLGKQIYKENIIAFNHMVYYKAVLGAIENGFKG